MKLPTQIALALMGCLLLAPAPGKAQQSDFPSRTVTLVVPYPPGGGNDILARIIGQKLGEIWKKPVVIENKPGANGMLGLDAVARAAPDGHTLGMGSDGPMATNKSLYKKMPYDPQADFAPVAMVATYRYVLAASPASGIKSVDDLLRLGRDPNTKLNYASVGAGSPHHLAMELFKSLAKIELQQVQYRGGAPALNALMGGEIQVMFTGIAGVADLAAAGKLTPLAISGPQRNPLLPEVRSMAEAGFPDYDIANWFGLVAPAGTPKAVIDRIHADLVTALNAPDVLSRLKPTGFEPKLLGPGDFSKHIASEIGRWGEIVRTVGVRIE